MLVPELDDLVDAASERIVFEIDSSTAPRQHDASQPILKVPSVGSRARRIDYGLGVTVVVDLVGLLLGHISKTVNVTPLTRTAQRLV